MWSRMNFTLGHCLTIYGGDWPVATQATTYPRWVETLDWILEGCSKDELQKIYHDNAIDFYRLHA